MFAKCFKIALKELAWLQLSCGAVTTTSCVTAKVNAF